MKSGPRALGQIERVIGSRYYSRFLLESDGRFRWPCLRVRSMKGCYLLSPARVAERRDHSQEGLQFRSSFCQSQRGRTHWYYRQGWSQFDGTRERAYLAHNRPFPTVATQQYLSGPTSTPAASFFAEPLIRRL